MDTGLVILHIWPALCMAHTERPTNVINECLLSVNIINIMTEKQPLCCSLQLSYDSITCSYINLW